MDQSNPADSRVIAISYRDKEVVREGVVIEQRPTMALVVDGDKQTEIMLPSEDHEMCFLLSSAVTLPSPKTGGKEIAIDFTEHGIRAGDTVLMIMGGSGAFFAFALSKNLEKLGTGGVYWIGSTLFKRLCDEHNISRSKVKSVDDEGRRVETTFDHKALSSLFLVTSHSFHKVSSRERDLISLEDVVSRRVEAMGARMACAHRVRQRMKKLAYCVQDAYPEGGVKLFIEHGVANDDMLVLFEKEEKKIEAELKKLLRSLSVWKVFASIEGVGELTAAPLIVAIGDINRFPSASQLKAFLGMHTLKADGSKFQKGDVPAVGNSIFARRRQGQLSNWSQEGRQALYLIATQFTMWRPNSPWGLVAKEVKKNFLAKYPHREVWTKDKEGNVTERVKLIEGTYKRVQGGYEVTSEDGQVRTILGVTKFNPAHINRMVSWRVMTKFVEWLYKAWKNTEAGKELPQLPYLKNAEVLLGDVSVQKVA